MSGPTNASRLKQLVGLGPGETLWGVADAARKAELAFEPRVRHGLEIHSLFDGASADSLAHVAPYLVPVDPEGPYLESWGAALGSSAGILLVSMAPRELLWKHLRSVFVSRSETGQDYFFRFYDPRVLRPFVPTCSAGQLAELFGPVLRFLVEAEDPAVLLRYRLESGRLATDRLPLAAGEAPATP